MAVVKAAMHTHSTWSYDGSWTLAQIARFFGRWGYDAVLMTEHDTGFAPDRFEDYRRQCAKASTDRCKLIPGIEYSSPENDVHILTWGLDRFYGEHRPVRDILYSVQDGGGVAIFAHPQRRDAWKLFRETWVELLHGVEIWNRKTDGVAPGARAIDLMRSTNLPPTVGMDFHRINQAYPLHMSLDLVGAPLSETTVVDAVRENRMTPRAFRRNAVSEQGEPLALDIRREERRQVIKRLMGRS